MTVGIGNPVYLAIADDSTIRRVAAEGVPGTAMPAFAQKVGGMLTDDDAAEAERLMPDCSRVRLPKSGHLIHWLQTETCLRLVNSFLESLEIR